uniref:Uncharacterized protein n=1 Tax=Fagus sylvatica TaxID=28930 RepID=A0A2N9IMF5_FAGSY
MLFDGSHDALLGSDLIALNIHYSKVNWEMEFLVKRGRHGLQFIQPSSAYDGCIWGSRSCDCPLGRDVWIISITLAASLVLWAIVGPSW